MNNTDKKEPITNECVQMPVTVSIENFKTQLSDLLNNSNLHPFILDSIMKDAYEEVHMVYQQQVVHEKKQYEEAMNKPHPKTL